jgi:hypothetical protein
VGGMEREKERGGRKMRKEKA